MRQCTIILAFCLFSCKNSSTEYVTTWTNAIKDSIIIDANAKPDTAIYDSSNHLTLFKNNKKLKWFYLKPIQNNKNEIIYDTAVSILYSKNNEFELLKEHCPIAGQDFQVVKYNGEWIGLVEYKDCSGKIKERGFVFEDVKVWYKYDSSGKQINEEVKGNTDNFFELKKIKYNR